MELNELKNIWQELDQKIEKNNILNDKVIKDMLQTKGNKSISKLMAFEVLSLILLVAMIPVFLFLLAFFQNATSHLNYTIVFIKLMIIFCVLAVVWYGVKIYFLNKIEMRRSIKDNIYNITRYKLLLKREIQISFILYPIILGVCIYHFYTVKATVLLWVLLICLWLVVLVFVIWFYKKVTQKHIKSINQSLDELKDLEEIV